jgi:hypothetical protein
MARVSSPRPDAGRVRDEIDAVGSRIGICRTIVAPIIVRGTCGCEADGVGAPNSSRRKPTLPKASRSSIVALPFSILVPFTNVPLLDPRSRSESTVPSDVSSAWRREMVGSKTGRSQVGARPTMSGTPSRRS